MNDEAFVELTHRAGIEFDPAVVAVFLLAAERQGVVHRLDVGTSGLMVVAKSERAYTVLKDAFRERTVDMTETAARWIWPARTTSRANSSWRVAR